MTQAMYNAVRSPTGKAHLTADLTRTLCGLLLPDSWKVIIPADGRRWCLRCVTRRDPAVRLAREVEWWQVPDTEDILDAAEELQLMREEFRALVEANDRELYVYQHLLKYGDQPDKMERWRKWVIYHQARVRQWKEIEAALEARRDEQRSTQA